MFPKNNLAYTSGLVEESPAQSNLISVARITGWAVYLAMSWTWCIGMYLPVLIMRELGFAGVITFAVPNMVGAMAMGWMLRDEQQSREIIGENRFAFVWYSLITIAFHAFFAAWIIRQIAGPHAGFAVVGVFLFFWIVLHWRRGGEFLATGLGLIVCAGLIGWGFWRGDLPYVAHPVWGTSISAINNLWLAPGVVAGICLLSLAGSDFSRGAARDGTDGGAGGFFAGLRRHIRGNAADHRGIQRVAGGRFRPGA